MRLHSTCRKLFEWRLPLECTLTVEQAKQLLKTNQRDALEGCPFRGVPLDKLPVSECFKSGAVLVCKQLMSQNGCYDEIISAASGGHLDLVSMLLPDVMIPSWLVSACCAAIQNGHDHIADYIMQFPQKFTDNHRDQYLLNWAAKKGAVKVCKFLVTLGYLIDNYYSDTTPLIEAAKAGHLAVCQYLISVGADPFKTGDHSSLLIHYTAVKKSIELCAWVLDLGLDVNSRNEKGRTPLFYAVTNGDLDLCRFLVSKGADIHVVDEFGETLMGIAAAFGYTAIVCFLVENGIQVDAIRTKNYFTREWQLGRYYPGIKSPVSQHSPGWHRGRPRIGETALWTALIFGRFETVEKLMALGAQHQKHMVFGILDMYVGIQPDEERALQLADPRGYLRNQPSWKQQTLLEYCVMHTMTAYCRLFLEHGADPNHENQHGQTALHENARQGDPEVCVLLLKHGAKVNHQDKDGNTPLHFAMRDGRLKVCRLLLQSGAVHLKNNNGQFPADLFAPKNHPKMFRTISLEDWMQKLAASS
ncbi:ankyrin repeat-containing domain protein [Gorgonomyces haynaldii]|nr:ankyrin repeat-containing domain protein [Gorgonomyces haynaldii]